MAKVLWSGPGSEGLAIDFGHGLTALIAPFYAGIGVYRNSDGHVQTVTYGRHFMVHLEPGEDATVYSGVLALTLPAAEGEALVQVLDGTLPLAPREAVDLSDIAAETKKEPINAA